MPQLIIHNREDKWEVELGDHTKIGRVLVNDIFLEDANISRYHAEITLTEKGYLFKGLGSSNGSFIKDVRIKESLLSNGTTVRIGKKAKLTFIEDLTDTTPAGLVRIASTPISEQAILDRIKLGEEDSTIIFCLGADSQHDHPYIVQSLFRLNGVHNGHKTTSS